MTLLTRALFKSLLHKNFTQNVLILRWIIDFGCEIHANQLGRPKILRVFAGTSVALCALRQVHCSDSVVSFSCHTAVQWQLPHHGHYAGKGPVFGKT